ncbi:MAG: UDP-N-acetylmuramate--L-alanine ligase [Angelakisella sp.]|jgi:UDP-N-acetylmuramate--alanine ligase|nr:UDP-N-acetylmuramate--L-alanine ligase [Angelakisella sp.]
MKNSIEIPAGVKHIHCIGVGGSGMFPIVQILLSQGYRISGSDNNESDILAAERKLGVEVTLGHSPENLEGADLVLYSAAIMADNPELTAAREKGLPLWERARMLGAISSHYPEAVGVCGTHGKTTVTSMLTQILYGAGKDPSAVIGGKLRAIDGYGRAGKSGLFVYEACEFRDTFLSTYPDTAIVLNIDDDHLDYFGTVENAMKSFTRFAGMARRVLYNGDDANTVRAMEAAPTPEKLTFGRGEENDFWPAHLQKEDGLCRSFTLMHRRDAVCRVTIHVPGDHNVLNAVAAAAAAWLLGVSPEDIAAHLGEFTGAGRRFEVLGKVRGFTVVDDYAHHPAELAATLRAAKELGFRRVWAVFQPFTFSRTYLLLEDFVKALSIADRVVLSPIMGSREKNEWGIRSGDLGEKIPGCVWLDSFEEMAEYVLANAGEGDLVITLGCGDIYKCARMILAD